MNLRLQGAMAAAMSLFKSSDIAGANAAIRQTLAGGVPLDEDKPSSTNTRGDVGSKHPRRLGDFLRTPGTQRASRPRGLATPGRTSEDAADGDRFTSRNHRSPAEKLNYKL